MKTSLIILGLFGALVCDAQTNEIIVPQLLSPTNTVLMTNAELRGIYGNRLLFRSGADNYHFYHAGDLSPSMLVAIGITTNQLAAKQAAVDEAARIRKEQLAAQRAEQSRQARLAQLQADAAQEDYERMLSQNHNDGWGGHRNRLPARERAGIGAP